MFTNKIGCTVYERTIGDNRMEAYVRHFIPTIYWEDTRGQVQSSTSMNQQDSVLCIIPASSLTDYTPKCDDKITCGRCDSEEPPKDGLLTIMSVQDFRYGSPAVQHIEVVAV